LTFSSTFRFRHPLGFPAPFFRPIWDIRVPKNRPSPTWTDVVVGRRTDRFEWKELLMGREWLSFLAISPFMLCTHGRWIICLAMNGTLFSLNGHYNRFYQRPPGEQERPYLSRSAPPWSATTSFPSKAGPDDPCRGAGIFPITPPPSGIFSSLFFNASHEELAGGS